MSNKRSNILIPANDFDAIAEPAEEVRTFLRLEITEFRKLDWWLWWRLFRWLRKKYPKTSPKVLARRFLMRRSGGSRRWAAAGVVLRKFTDGGTGRYPYRGTRVTNGWDARPGEWFRRAPADVWTTMNTLQAVA